MTEDNLIDDGGEHPIVPWLTQRRRAWVYRVVVAGATVAATLGVISEAEAVVAAAAAAALLSTGLAALNTPTR